MAFPIASWPQADTMKDHQQAELLLALPMLLQLIKQLLLTHSERCVLSGVDAQCILLLDLHLEMLWFNM